MLYAIMSDVHAHPRALAYALEDARACGAGKFVCLGDVVGYGPDAQGAVKLARACFDVVLMGNHDAATVGLISSWNFRPEAKAGVCRHGLELDADALAWLKGLPYVYRARSFVAAHGSIVTPEAFAYIMTEGAALAAFDRMEDGRPLFVGHTHASLGIRRKGSRRVEVYDPTELTLADGERYIVNVGSVGYPRNEPESVYVLWDSRRRTVVWRRLPFDYTDYAAQMAAHGIALPDWYAESAAAATRGQKR